VALCAFDPTAASLCRAPLEAPKRRVARLIGKPTLGCEGIVSKRLGSRYVSGRTRDWLKFKTPRRRQ